MADLEDIVRKRRSSLVEGQRRQFSVARVEAVRKMRKFALEDPRYYLLELIQSAVANDAGFISIDLFRVETDRDELKMRWTGDGFSRIELLNLFDVLLESEGDGGRADIQMFARAVNAMLLFEPDRLLLASSGPGRRGVTCEIRGDGSEIVELRNTSDYDGVHIFASGMKGSRLPRIKDADQRVQYAEKKLIQERCVMPDVSVMFNGREVSHITWTLHDRDVYPEDVVHIDEGDLYGELWPSPSHKDSYFDLMTWGVKIDRVRNELGPFAGISGAVVFNKLKKTADHAKIVRDENFDRLWARLRPYAEILQGKREELGYDVSLPGTGGAPLRPDELLEQLIGTDRVLMISPIAEPSAGDNDLALELARSLDARLLVADPEHDPLIRLLAGDQVELIRTDFSLEEVRFYRSEPVGPPPRPWLVEAAESRAIPVEEFTEELARAGGVSREGARVLEDALGTHGSVHLRVYTPEALRDGDESLDRRWVRVLTCQREVWSGGIETAFPGHILYVDVPPVPPSQMHQSVSLVGGGSQSVASLVAEHAVREARDELEWATSNALDALGRTSVPAGSHASRLALHALGRQTILSLSHEDGRIGLSMLAAEPDRALLGVPLFETVSGSAVDGEGLERLLERGLIAAVRRADDVDWSRVDIDAADVLVLDDEQERLLVHIVGGNALIRLDAHVDSPESEDLLAELHRTGNDAVDQERRRRARRSLLAYLVECEHRGIEPADASARDEPLVEVSGGGAITVGRLFELIEASGAVVMSDGRAADVVTPYEAAVDVEGPVELKMDPHLAALLRDLDAVRGPEDASVVEHAADDATLDRVAVESSTIRGYLAIPAEQLDDPVVTLVDRDSGRVRALRQGARRFGVVGTLAVELEEGDELPIEQARRQIDHHARMLFEKQMGRMSDKGGGGRGRRLQLLLDFAGRFVRLSADDQRRVEFDIPDELALRILELPLFPTDRGVPVSGMRLLREFARAQTVGEPLFLTLSDAAPEPVIEWVERHLDPDRIYREAHRPPAAITVDEDAELFEQLEGAFAEIGLGAQPGGELELRRWPHDREHLIRLYGFNRGISQKLQNQRELFVLVEGDSASAVTLVTGHPLLEQLAQLEPRERLSWLMLGVYSCINAARIDVRNDHELAFQRRLIERLLSQTGTGDPA